MNWNLKHAFYLGKVMGTLHKEMHFSMSPEEEQVYDRVMRAIDTIAEVEVYGEHAVILGDPVSLADLEQEEDTLH
jgi:hypothetical protein